MTPSLDVLREISELQIRLGQRTEAIVPLERLRRLAPNTPWVYRQLGNLYVAQRDYATGWERIHKGAALNEAACQLAVATTLYNGSPEINLEPDHAAGLAWIRKASEKGEKDATTFLRAHPT